MVLSSYMCDVHVYRYYHYITYDFDSCSFPSCFNINISLCFKYSSWNYFNHLESSFPGCCMPDFLLFYRSHLFHLLSEASLITEASSWHSHPQLFPILWPSSKHKMYFYLLLHSQCLTSVWHLLKLFLKKNKWGNERMKKIPLIHLP